MLSIISLLFTQRVLFCSVRIAEDDTKLKNGSDDDILMVDLLKVFTCCDAGLSLNAGAIALKSAYVNFIVAYTCLDLASLFIT